MSMPEVLGMLAMVVTVHLLVVSRVKSFGDVVASWGDNPAYLEIAAIVRQWHFPGGPLPYHFWGFPFAIAGVARLFSLPAASALSAVSLGASVAVYALVQRLYGGRVAAATFVFLNYQWILSFVEGGSEPLFMCLLYASFLAVRVERWTLASLLASLATTVRPVGIFALVCVAIVLVRRKRYGQLVAITGVGLAIGVLYVTPVWVLLGSPLANFFGYQSDWRNGWPLTYPLGAVIPGFFAFPAGVRWTHYAMSVTWLLIGIAGGVTIWRSRNRQDFTAFQPEAMFTSLYVLFYLSYNLLPVYGASELPRFFFPVLPPILFSWRDWLPRDRRVLWASALLSALLTAAVVLRTG
jgi:hypothetical protein